MTNVRERRRSGPQNGERGRVPEGHTALITLVAGATSGRCTARESSP